jgi:hypothetical protein
MHASIAAEQCNEYGAFVKKHQPRQQGQRSGRSAKKHKVNVAGMGDEIDPEDSDFMSDSSSAVSLEGGDTEVDEAQPSNAEVFHILRADASNLNAHLPCLV